MSDDRWADRFFENRNTPKTVREAFYFAERAGAMTSFSENYAPLDYAVHAHWPPDDEIRLVLKLAGFQRWHEWDSLNRHYAEFWSWSPLGWSECHCPECQDEA